MVSERLEMVLMCMRLYGQFANNIIKAVVREPAPVLKNNH